MDVLATRVWARPLPPAEALPFGLPLGHPPWPCEGWLIPRALRPPRGSFHAKLLAENAGDIGVGSSA